MSQEIVYADVFGVKFPVCSLEQKAGIEEAFRVFQQTDISTIPNECFCQLITKLLRGEASLIEQQAAGAFVAKNIYQEKMVLGLLAQAAEDAVMSAPVNPKETVH